VPVLHFYLRISKKSSNFVVGIGDDAHTLASVGILKMVND